MNSANVIATSQIGTLGVQFQHLIAELILMRNKTANHILTGSVPLHWRLLRFHVGPQVWPTNDSEHNVFFLTVLNFKGVLEVLPALFGD